MNSRHSNLDKGVETFLLITTRTSSENKQQAAINRHDAIKAPVMVDLI